MRGKRGPYTQMKIKATPDGRIVVSPGGPGYCIGLTVRVGVQLYRVYSQRTA